MKNWQFDVHVVGDLALPVKKKHKGQLGSHKLHTIYRMVNGCVCIESKFLLWKTLRIKFQMAIDVWRQQVVEAQ